jgi:hypothetical protein
MRVFYTGIALVFAMIAMPVFADTITLRSGNVINGTYLGGTARTVRMDMGDDVRSVDVSDIVRIEFGGAPVMSSRQDRSDRPSDRPRIFRPEVEPPPPPPSRVRMEGGATLPAGTNFVIRMIDAVDSQTNRVGQSFAASLDQPVMVDGETVIPRGADVVVKLVDSKESGKLAGRAMLALSLQAVRVNGQLIDVNTQSVKEESASRTGRTAKVAGGTAAVGAIIGGIAGGGTGAAIGAGAGAAAGTGVQLATSGQRVRVPSETRLTFVLDNPVRM